MKILIFGTGEYYQKYKSYLNKSEIVAFVDNDREKVGSKIDGINILSVREGLRLQFDKIVLMSVWKNEMLNQLLDAGVEIQKIIDYTSIQQLTETPKNISRINYKKKENKRILLVQKYFYNSGAPRALIALAKQIKELNYYVEVCTTGGAKCMLQELERIVDNLYVIDYLDVTDDFLIFYSSYNLIILNTVELIELALRMETLKIPVVFWLHESMNMFDFNMQQLCKRLKSKNFIIWAVSEVAKQNFLNYNNQYLPQIVTLGIPRFEAIGDQGNKNRYDNKIIIAVIGYISEVKGHDIFLNAIHRLSTKEKEQIEIWVIGNTSPANDAEKEYNLKMIKEMRTTKEIKLLGELDYNELQNCYNDIDIIICPSRAETLSIAVIEGLMNKKLCIVSNAAGVVNYLEHGINSLIFENENEFDLYEKILWAVNHREMWTNICSEGEKVYERYFSENTFRSEVNCQIKKVLKEFKFS